MKKIYLSILPLSFFLFFGGCVNQRANINKNETQELISNEFKYKDCNIIFVSLDALQAKFVHTLGYPKKITPTIDRLAEKSFVFTNAISVSSWTVPSTMSFFTGVYPSEHKLVNKFSLYDPPLKKIANLKNLSPRLITLAEILKENGYVTAGFTGGAGVSGVFGFNQGFDVYIDDVKFGNLDYSIPGALAWLNKNKNRKFFIFLHGYDVHGQSEPSGGFDYRYVDKTYDYKFKGTKKEQEALREEGLSQGKIILRDNDVKFWRAVYEEKINRMDSALDRFLTEIEKLNLMQNTILFVVSDHGTEFWEHNRFDHGFTLYDELIRIPLIIKLPNQATGKRIADQVTSVDILPTILDLLDIGVSGSVKNQLRGMSLTPAFYNLKISRDVYAESDYRRYTYKRALRTVDGWKFIYTLENKDKELYDLRNDPGETINLFERRPRIAYELEQKLFRFIKSTGQDEFGPWVTGNYPVYDSQAQ